MHADKLIQAWEAYLPADKREYFAEMVHELWESAYEHGVESVEDEDDYDDTALVVVKTSTTALVAVKKEEGK